MKPPCGSALLSCAALLSLLVTGIGTPVARAQNSAGIYTCIDAKGRRLTSDRPIPECLDRAQDLRNKDGSVRARARKLFRDEAFVLVSEEFGFRYWFWFPEVSQKKLVSITSHRRINNAVLRRKGSICHG